jgi:hypothetical protein
MYLGRLHLAIPAEAALQSFRRGGGLTPVVADRGLHMCRRPRERLKIIGLHYSVGVCLASCAAP